MVVIEKNNGNRLKDQPILNSILKDLMLLFLEKQKKYNVLTTSNSHRNIWKNKRIFNQFYILKGLKQEYLLQYHFLHA